MQNLPDGNAFNYHWQNGDKDQARDGLGLNRYKYKENKVNRFQCADKHYILIVNLMLKEVLENISIDRYIHIWTSL